MTWQRIEYRERGPEPERLVAPVTTAPRSPERGETLVEVLAAPINPADLLAITGEYGALAPLPATAGSEGVGRVVEHGPGTDGPAPGTRVVLPFGSGTWASHLIAATEALLPLPDGADDLQLAMLTCNPAAALLMLDEFVDLPVGAWVIQNAANSGVGASVIQLARLRGVKTVNVVRRVEACEAVSELGGDVALVDGDDLAERVAEATDGAAIHLALDAVGGGSTGRLAESLACGGQVVTYGLLSGEPCAITPFQLIFRQIRLCGFWRAKWFRDAEPQRREAILRELAEHIATGRLRTPVHATFGLDDAAEAVALARAGGRQGKVLLVPNG